MLTRSFSLSIHGRVQLGSNANPIDHDALVNNIETESGMNFLMEDGSFILTET